MLDEVKEKLLSSKNFFGYDASQGEMVDMVKAGIVDPAKLLRIALQNAASTGGLMLTAKTFLTDLKEDAKKIAESVV